MADRASVFAGIRVYTTIKLLYTTDIAYWGALMGLSTFPEIAAGFVVLSLPVLPHFYKSMRRKLGFHSESSQKMSGGFERKERRTPRSWLHISQDSATQDTNASHAGKRLAITRTDHVVIEFMSLGSTESILPAAPETALPPITNRHK